MNDEEKEYLDAQENRQLTGTAQQTALRAAAEHKEHTVHNENFLNELRKTDLEVDDDLKESLEERYPTWFSGARSVTNRSDDWDLQSDLIMQNKRERAIAERRPGRLLRDRPFMQACMTRAESPPLEAYAGSEIPGDERYWREKLSALSTADEPATSADQSRIYGAAEVAADLMTLSRTAAGLEAVSTVKTETNVRRSEEDEGTASRVGKILE